ncbi:MAG: hypothetical protein RBT65_10475 [Methanolobus sp.]|jgi:hypothetical protein|nr:hypothetical protein [Methanolobus sp.]
MNENNLSGNQSDFVLYTSDKSDVKAEEVNVQKMHFAHSGEIATTGDFSVVQTDGSRF